MMDLSPWRPANVASRRHAAGVRQLWYIDISGQVAWLCWPRGSAASTALFSNPNRRAPSPVRLSSPSTRNSTPSTPPASPTASRLAYSLRCIDSTLSDSYAIQPLFITASPPLYLYPSALVLPPAPVPSSPSARAHPPACHAHLHPPATTHDSLSSPSTVSMSSRQYQPVRLLARARSFLPPPVPLS